MSCSATICGQSEESTEKLAWFWPITKGKPKIRWPLRQRISGLPLILGQNLKHQIRGLLILAALLLQTDGTQVGIDRYVDDQSSPKQPSDEPNVGKPTSSDEPDDDSNDSEEETTDTERDKDDYDTTDDRPKGLIYARVSSESQTANDETENEDSDDTETDVEKGSINGQIQKLETKAEQEGIELPYEPITDKAETGTNFERDGIQEVFDICLKEDIDLLLVEKIDRIGRNTPQTLYFIYILQSECGVTILTPAGEKDVGEMRGLLHTTLMSLMAEVQNQIRTAKASDERIRKFLKDKKWKSYYTKVPLGYSETEDDWLSVNPEEKQIVRDLFRKFVQCENYNKTERYIDEEYGPDVLDGHNVKTLLQNSVYIGRPRIPEEQIKETSYENNLSEPDLNILKAAEDAEVDVSEDIFHRAQEIIEEKDKRHSTQEDTIDLDDLLEKYGLFPVVEGSKPAKLVHECGAPLVKDGQVTLKGRQVHRYRCRNCEESDDAKQYYRTWPKAHELDKIEQIHRVVEDGSSAFDSK